MNAPLFFCEYSEFGMIAVFRCDAKAHDRCADSAAEHTAEQKTDHSAHLLPECSSVISMAHPRMIMRTAPGRMGIDFYAGIVV